MTSVSLCYRPLPSSGDLRAFPSLLRFRTSRRNDSIKIKPSSLRQAERRLFPAAAGSKQDRSVEDSKQVLSSQEWQDLVNIAPRAGTQEHMQHLFERTAASWRADSSEHEFFLDPREYDRKRRVERQQREGGGPPPRSRNRNRADSR